MAADNVRLQVILNGIDKLSAPFRAAKEGASSLSKIVSQQKQELLALNKSLDNISGYKKLTDESQTLSNSLVAAKQRLKDLTAQIVSTQNPSKNLKQEFDEARRSVKALEYTQELHNKTLIEAKQRLGDAGKNAGTMAAHERQLRGAIESTNASLNNQNKKLERLQDRQRRIAQHKQAMQSAIMRGAAGYGLVQTASGTLENTLAPAVSAFAELEAAKTQLKVSLMNAKGDVGADFEQIAALATKLGDRLPGTTSDFMNMMTMLKKQGMSSTAILGGLGEAAAYIGVQLKLPSEQAAEFASKMQDATRTQETDMMGLMDVIQRMSGVGVETDNMLQAFMKLSPAMDMVKRQGLDGAKAFAPFIVMMDQAGMRGESAGNAIRKVVQASLNVDKIKDATFGTGISLNFTNGKGEFGGIEKMMSELQKLKKLNTVKRLEVMKGVFGDDAETLQVLAKVIDQGQAGYDSVVKKMQAQADLQQRVNEQLGTLSALWEAASGTFTNTLAVFGEAISPELKSLTQWFGSLSEKLGAFAKEHPGVVRAVVAIIVVLTALMAVIGVVMMGIAAFGAAFALITSPITITVLAVVALIALLATSAYMVYNNWDGIVGGLKALWESLVDVVKSVGNAISIAWDSMIEAISRKLEWIFGKYDALKSALGSGWDWVKEKTGFGGVVNAGKQITAGVAMGAAAAMPLAAAPVQFNGGGMLKAPAVAAGQQAAAPIAITVMPSPGMDEKLLAKEVQKQMSAAQQRDAAAKRSKLSDKD